MRPSTAALVVLLICPAELLGQTAKSTSSTPSVSVPRLINISGVFRPADGGRPDRAETVTLGIYSEETGEAPLWHETQKVAVDAAGRYTVLLGATESDGVPLTVFASGEARWLGMTWLGANEVEGPRTRLTSVPYALKASEAETLGGLPASAYQLAPLPGDEAATVSGAASGESTASLVNAGTTNLLAKYVSGTDVGNSSVFESGGLVGINTTTPFDVIHSRFLNTNGGMTGLAVQNLGSSATSYSGMLFYDQNGSTAQFQGFNNATHEYRINNVSSGGSINFMLGGASRFLVHPTIGTVISGPASILPGASTIGLFVSSSGSTGISVGTTDPTGTSIFAQSPAGDSGVGVFGAADTGTAVVGLAETSGAGVWGQTDTGAAVVGFAGNLAVGWAGVFDGDVNVLGTLFKGGGAFRIDHPLDPENKYLSHSFVESPDMKNIYDGVAVFEDSGEATVTLPDWFEALNQDFRYQLTPMGAPFVPYVAEEIAGRQFKIGGGVPGKKVSWQVTGVRHDAFANANRIQVEELKSGTAVGTYLHPRAFGLSAEKVRSKATTKDERLRTAEERKARLRAISQKSSKQ